jgi:GTPase KRas
MIEVLDTAGQEEYTAMREQYMRAGEGFVLVYSITSRSSFKRVKLYHDQLLGVKKDTPTPIVLVGNKCDLATSPAREVSTEDGEALAKELGVRSFFETSAKTPVHVDEAFEEAVMGIQAAKRAEQESSETKKRKREKEEKQREKEERSIQNRLSRFMAKLKSSK